MGLAVTGCFTAVLWKKPFPKGGGFFCGNFGWRAGEGVGAY